MEKIVDVPVQLLSSIKTDKICAAITTTQAGVISGVEGFLQAANRLDLCVEMHLPEGALLEPQAVISRVIGTPLQIVAGEDCLLGYLAKPSGVATAAFKAKTKAGKIRVVCGGWKKILSENKVVLRKAAETAGLDSRILNVPFIYLDKNYVRIFGSIPKAIEAALDIRGRAVVVQLKGETTAIEKEAILAAQAGASVIMVDTGNILDLRKCSQVLKEEGFRDKVELSFAGGVKLEDLDSMKQEDVDVIDMGRVILDAPMLDLRYDIIKM